MQIPPRSFQILNLVIGAVIVVLLAAISAGLLAQSAIWKPRAVVGIGSAAPAAAARSEELKSYQPILANGLFGRATRGELSAVAGQTGPASPAAAPAGAPGDLVLLGTVQTSYRDAYVMVRSAKKQEERVFHLGESVFDAGRLVHVGKERAFILVAGKKVELLPPTAPAPPGGAGAPAGPAGSGVLSLGGGSFVIDQRAFNSALDSPAQAMSDARLLPSEKDGKVEGFRVSAVKPAGFFAMVGMKDGDVLLRLNDFPIDAPDKALQSFIALKGQTKLKLDLIRDGRPATFNYDIR